MPDGERLVQTDKQGSFRDILTLRRTLLGAVQRNRAAQIGEGLRKL